MITLTLISVGNLLFWILTIHARIHIGRGQYHTLPVE
jgi:hypothetical protein